MSKIICTLFIKDQLIIIHIASSLNSSNSMRASLSITQTAHFQMNWGLKRWWSYLMLLDSSPNWPQISLSCHKLEYAHLSQLLYNNGKRRMGRRNSVLRLVTSICICLYG